MLIFLHLYFSCYRAQIYPIKCDGFEPIIHFLEEECLSLSFPFSALDYHDGEIWILQEEYCDQIEDGQCEIQFYDKYHFVKQLQVLPQDMYGKTQQETLIYMEFDKNQHADQLKCHGYISLTPNQYLPNFIFDKNLNLCLDLEIGFLTKESIYLPDQYVSINFEKDSPNYIIQSSKLIINQKSFEILQYKTVLDSSDQLQFPEEIFTEISIIFINMGFQLINGYLMIQSDIQINGILPIIKIEIEGQQLDIHPYNYFKTNYNNWGYDIIMIANSNNVFSQNQLILGKPFLINRMINIDLLNYQIKLIDNINCQNYLQQVIYEREKYWLLLSLVLFFITSYLLYRKSMKLEQIKRETHMELTEI